MGIFWKSELSKEEFEYLDKTTFEGAKKLSDFVGMIVRLGFLGVALVIVWNNFEKEDAAILIFCYGISLLLLTAITLAQVANINSIVMHFFIKRIIMIRISYARRFLHSLIYICMMAFYMGFTQVAIELARKGSS